MRLFVYSMRTFDELPFLKNSVRNTMWNMITPPRRPAWRTLTWQQAMMWWM